MKSFSSFLSGKITSIDFAPPAEAAKAALRAAVKKPRDHFYPWWTRSVSFAFGIMPNVLEWSEAAQYNQEALTEDYKTAKAIYDKRYTEAYALRKKKSS